MPYELNVDDVKSVIEALVGEDASSQYYEGLPNLVIKILDNNGGDVEAASNVNTWSQEAKIKFLEIKAKIGGSRQKPFDSAFEL